MSHEIRIPKKTNPDSMESFYGVFVAHVPLEKIQR